MLGAYIKRCGNLLLIRESGETAPVSELVKALEESVQNLELTDAECGITCTMEKEQEIPAAVMVEAYACFERVAEALMGKVAYLWISLREKEGELLLRMEAETAAEIPPLDGADIREEDGVKEIAVRYALGGERP